MNVTIECSHCGGIAATSPDGTFTEDDSRFLNCAECGHPGLVRVASDSDDVAWFLLEENGRCTRSSCEECR